ncbi:cytochrome P450 [Nocardia sp. NPDC059239]
MSTTSDGLETPATWRRDHHNDFDLDSVEFNEEYESAIDDLVARCPVAHSSVGKGYHVVSRYADVRRIAQDWQNFSSADGYQPNRPEEMPPIYPDECDPPYQTRWRRQLDHHLSPRVVRSYEASVTEHANFLIDQFIERGEFDVVSEFASVLPSRVWFNSFLGLPVEDLPPLMDAVEQALVGPIEGRTEGWGKLFSYLDAHLKKRDGEEPRDDMMSAVLAGVELDEGFNPSMGGGPADAKIDMGAPCPWSHKVAALSNVTAGGLGTATYLIAGMAQYLAANPEDAQRLRDDESLRPQAIEEFIRAFASVVAMARTATSEVEVAGTTFQPGDRVVLLFPGATRDPEIYENPGEIDIDRNFTVNAAFGFGPHRCIGSHLARLLGKVALATMLERLPDLTAAEGNEPRYLTSVTREVSGIKLSFTPGLKLGGE